MQNDNLVIFSSLTRDKYIFRCLSLMYGLYYEDAALNYNTFTSSVHHLFFFILSAPTELIDQVTGVLKLY